jgi:hypothetical protein
MSDGSTTEFQQLWKKYSKEDLWNRVTEWWESARRTRIVMLLAMHHDEELPLSLIVEKVGESEDFVLSVLNDLERNGQVSSTGDAPKKYRILDEDKFLEYISQCCQRTSAAAGLLSTLASWSTSKK